MQVVTGHDITNLPSLSVVSRLFYGHLVWYQIHVGVDFYLRVSWGHFVLSIYVSLFYVGHCFY